jgi:non-specific serine/threonine protein kinase
MPEPELGSFGAQLRRARLAAGLSQEALAARIGLSVVAISKLERGVSRRPFPETIRLLAGALELDTAAQKEFLASSRPDIAAPNLSTAPAIPAPSGLPVPASLLVGRERELAAVRYLLLATEGRLLTLTGTGGIGKTRLALALAHDVASAFPDGVWAVELAALADPDLVPAAVAAALGLSEQAGRVTLTSILDRLRSAAGLLLLDNCEHVLGACAALAVKLLAACPQLRLLATSRETLRLPGEQRYLVPALTAPDRHRLPGAELVGTYEAVRLFVTRVQERLPDFALDQHNAPAVAEICARLDGIPLALELAAARAGVLSVAAIAARLDDRFRLLTKGARTALPRQQTLRAALDWSWDLLDEAERRVLRRLATFPGGCALSATQAVCADTDLDAWDVLEALDALVEKSLVVAEEVTGETRYRLLETVRQYAAERLTVAGEEVAVRERQAAWCLGRAEEAVPGLTGAAQGYWLEQLEVEHDNLRAALEWALSRADLALGFRLAGSLWPFWQRHSHLSEGRRWLERALAADVQQRAAPELRATVLTGAAWLAHDQDDFARADALAAEGLDLFRALGQTNRVADVLGHRGIMARAQGRCADAVALLEESLALYRTLGDQAGVAYALFRLGLAVRDSGEYARATVLYQECLALYRGALDDRSGAAFALLGLGDIARDRGDPAAVEGYCAESLRICRELGRHWAVGFSLNNLALAAGMRGDMVGACGLAEEALAVFRAHSIQSGVAETLITLAKLACDQGDYQQARRHLIESLALGWPAGPYWLAAAALEELSRAAVASGHATDAARLSAATSQWRRATGVPLPPYRRAACDATLAEARRMLDTAAPVNHPGWAWNGS